MKPFVEAWYKPTPMPKNDFEEVQVWARHSADCVVSVYFADTQGGTVREIGFHFDLARDLIHQLETAIAQAHFVEYGELPETA